LKATIHVDSDQPVLVLVLPLPPRKCRELPADGRRVVDTTAEPAPANVVHFRKAVGQ
jgi:hypothetical protein